ncbi:MAG: homocysteine biosynthesis protein [Candidatus Hadarchaeales archaeon]
MVQVKKSVAEINDRIRRGSAVVLTAEEMVELVRSKGPAAAAKEVDVVTSGTFGAMCSSGAWLNFGHSDPPIKMQRVWLNDVEAYTGVAAVDAYIGATQLSETKGMEYGGGHVIEDLVRGKEIHLRATAYGTDCYPRKEIETVITKDDINQAVLLNPRNAYQRYAAATNSRDETIYTYMGTLLPNFGNVSYSGAGCLSPLSRDPTYETIGVGTRIFIGGAQGYVVWEGTQHDPKSGKGTIMTIGDLKEMSPKYIRGATIERYGVTLYVGIGIPIPILDENIARTSGTGDDELVTEVVDYGIPRRDRPVVRNVTYAELKSGKIEIKGKEVKVSPLSSLKRSREIARLLKELIEKGEFYLSEPAERLPVDEVIRPIRQARPVPFVRDVMTREVVTAKADDTVERAAAILSEKGFDHLPIIDEDGRVTGIVTSWDIAIAVGKGRRKLSEVMTSRVITAREDEPVDAVARKLETHNISGVPVVDSSGKLRGIVTTDDISRLFGRGKR